MNIILGINPILGVMSVVSVSLLVNQSS